MAANKKVRGATNCKSGSITFKSQLEKIIFNTLIEQGFTPQYEYKTYVLWDGFTPVTPFYDRETDAARSRRLEKGGTVESKMLVLKNSKIVGIRYTPDFYFKYKGLDVYIEAKGIENDVFYIKKKLFINYLDRKFYGSGQRSIFFEVYTKKQLLQSLHILENYVKAIEDNPECPEAPKR